MYSVIAVADAILRIAKEKGIKLTPLQLMKLTYIAHGWHLAIQGSDLFRERIEAWKYGPVIPDLYQATKRFGRSPIPFDLILDNEPEMDAQTAAFLTDVVEKYGKLSGFALSSLTHKSGTPWDMVFSEKEFGIEIPDDLIAQHYKELLSGQRGTAAA
ncbi:MULTISPECIES: Panacea domain-containing protein [unclassified Aurantimonas]|uniref:Panacea domain-containing protein n=1 Tax=unclassified Aurantimonas TaxID=2638230 RepID=UPI002E181A5E|nr:MULTISPECIES: type II toxin-antitoxin system antitoxin SocA domain-containing protein [unclassified Aurantimonas]MEC5293495.1 type II toxin-antitoxin system antitoxin SocA domain-containing protein [Aurantimonas sp. C2-3-R2]MEC5414569.1 type II toxin-antitoxin system antitoxin SocA domain-containing protein [Aurantimonas sp. C2-4-R8]